MRSFFSIIIFFLFSVFPAYSVLEQSADFSKKKIVGYYGTPAEHLEEGQQDLHTISQKITSYKKEILSVHKEKEAESKGIFSRLDLEWDSVQRLLNEPYAPSTRTLWNEFQHRLKGLALSRDDFSALYKALSPNRKIIEDPDKHLVRVSFSSCELGDEQLGSILHLLNDCSSLCILDLSGNQLTLRSLPHIIGFMGRLPKLNFVNLAHNLFAAQDLHQAILSPLIESVFHDQELLEKLILTDQPDDLEKESFNWMESAWQKNHHTFFEIQLSLNFDNLQLL